MSDVIVTIPKNIWQDWLEEGDLPGDPPTGEEWGYCTWGTKPKIEPGDRVYVCAYGRLRGYAPLTRMVFTPEKGALGRVDFGRTAGAVAITIPESIQGFRGWRYRFWQREVEIPFPNWKIAGVI